MPKRKRPPPAKTPEQLDEEELREVEGKIKELIQLLSARKSRPQADQELEQARTHRDEHMGSQESVYHMSGSSHVPTTMHTSLHLELAGKLKTRIQLGQYALELEDSLRRLSERYVAVLERVLERSRY